MSTVFTEHILKMKIVLSLKYLEFHRCFDCNCLVLPNSIITDTPKYKALSKVAAADTPDISDKCCSIAKLPEDVILHILKFVDRFGLCTSIVRISTQWRARATHNSVWKF
eukprot:1014170_1